MNKFRKMGLILFTLTLSGCDEISALVSENLYSGSTWAVSKCIERSSDGILSPSALKAACIAKHERHYENTSLEGKAAFQYRYYQYTFNGNLKNTSNDFVATGFTIKVTIKDNAYEPIEKVFSDYWIEPNNSIDIFNIWGPIG